MGRPIFNINVVNDFGDENFPVKQFKTFTRNVISDIKLSVSSVAIILVSDEYLRKLHRKFLNNESYTDVITFNLSDTRKVEAEIYISYNRAKIHANRYKVNVQTEIARLISHGLLHLKGFDDKTESERQRMYQFENGLIMKYWSD